MDTLQTWKDTLSKGRTVQIKMGSDVLAPAVRSGDMVTVGPAAFKDLKQGDIVLCTVGGRPGLRKIAQVRHIYGVRCLEVMDGGTTLQHIQESTVLGRMIYLRRQDGQVVGATGSNVMSSVHTVVRSLKRVLFPGT